jgi:hypothetical protein
MFIVITTSPSDSPEDIDEYYGPFATATDTGDSLTDAVTWMNKWVQAPVTARAIELFQPSN